MATILKFPINRAIGNRQAYQARQTYTLQELEAIRDALYILSEVSKAN